MILDLTIVIFWVILDLIPLVFSVILDLIHVVFPVKTHFVVATDGEKFSTTGGPPLATAKCVMATAVATGEAAMGSVVATGGLPWVVSTDVNIIFDLCHIWVDSKRTFFPCQIVKISYEGKHANL